MKSWYRNLLLQDNELLPAIATYAENIQHQVQRQMFRLFGLPQLPYKLMNSNIALQWDKNFVEHMPVDERNLFNEAMDIMPKALKSIHHLPISESWLAKGKTHVLKNRIIFTDTNIYICDEKINALNELTKKIKHHISGSTLVQAMDCCLKPLRYYLNKCLFIINDVQWLPRKTIGSIHNMR